MAINTGYSNIGLTPSSLKKANAAPPKVESREVAPAHIPAEKVILGGLAPLKTPRPGSDMDQIVQDLQSNGVIPQPQTEAVPSETARPKTLREPSSDYMSQMVDDVQKDLALTSKPVDVQVNNNGTIALLDDHVAGLDSHHAGGHGHGHGFKEDALLGGHIGTEILEKIGHNAHHAAGHATEAVGHGAAKAVGHGATETAGHGATKVASEAVGHGTAKAAAHGAEAHEVAGHALAVGKSTAHHLSAGLEVALGVGAVGAGILAVPITINGIKELKAGIKEKDTDKILEGVGNLAVGARSAGTAAVMTGMLTTSEVVTQVAGVAAQTLTPLGIVHAGVDTVLGVRDLTKGKVTEGLLKIGTGVAIGAAAIVGGLPLTVAALGMLGVKTGHKIYQHVQAKKQDAHEHQDPATQPQVSSRGADEVRS